MQLTVGMQRARAVDGVLRSLSPPEFRFTSLSCKIDLLLKVVTVINNNRYFLFIDIQ